MRPLPPYAITLGLRREGDIIVMPYKDDLIGSPKRLHGGAVAGLLEITGNYAALEALGDMSLMAKPINVTVDYLRAGAPRDTFAQARILRQGRRVINIQVEAWQESRDRLIATARMNMAVADRAVFNETRS